MLTSNSPERLDDEHDSASSTWSLCGSHSDKMSTSSTPERPDDEHDSADSTWSLCSSHSDEMSTSNIPEKPDDEHGSAGSTPSFCRSRLGGTSTSNAPKKLDDKHGSAGSTCSFESWMGDDLVENGRSYNSIKQGCYFLPSDEHEQNRLVIQHEAMRLATGDKLFHAPAHCVHEVLDLGTGTGIWATCMADCFPKANVIGVDISPIQPTMVPPNLKFELDDVEAEWTWSREFDIIYSQFMLSGSIADKQKYFSQAYEYCKPGGYFELHELQMNFNSQGHTVPDNLQEWWHLMRQGIAHFGDRTLDVDPLDICEGMKKAGFIDVVCEAFWIPLGTYAKDPTLKLAGRYQLSAMLEGISGLSLAIFTRALKWQLPEVEEFLAGVRRSLKSGKLLKLPCFVVYGRKPKGSQELTEAEKKDQQEIEECLQNDIRWRREMRQTLAEEDRRKVALREEATVQCEELEVALPYRGKEKVYVV